MPQEACPGDCNPNHFLLSDRDPAFSPYGLSIAYFHLGSIGNSGIYIINADGTGNRLWHKSSEAGNPSWSADGEWI